MKKAPSFLILGFALASSVACKQRTFNNNAAAKQAGSTTQGEGCDKDPSRVSPDPLAGALAKAGGDAEQVEVKKVFETMSSIGVSYCNRSGFVSIFKQAGGPVVFPAGPSGQGVAKANAEALRLSIQNNLIKPALNVAKGGQVTVITGISMRETGAETMDSLINTLATNFSNLRVAGALLTQYFGYGLEGFNADVKLHHAYLPAKDEEGITGFDMVGDSGTPVKAHAVLEALKAGRKVFVGLYDGGDISLREVKAILEGVKAAGGDINPSDFSLHVSYGWGIENAFKGVKTAAISLLTDPAGVEMLRSLESAGARVTFEGGVVLDDNTNESKPGRRYPDFALKNGSSQNGGQTFADGIQAYRDYLISRAKACQENKAGTHSSPACAKEKKQAEAKSAAESLGSRW